MGFTWAAALFAVGLVPRWVFGVYTDVPIPLVFGVFGFIAGITFSGLLVLTEGRRRFAQMSLSRFAGWGAVGIPPRPNSPSVRSRKCFEAPTDVGTWLQSAALRMLPIQTRAVFGATPDGSSSPCGPTRPPCAP